MRLNNKGFAVSTILYGILSLTIIILISLILYMILMKWGVKEYRKINV